MAEMWDWLSRKKKTLKSRFAARGPKLPPNGSAKGQIYAPHGAFFIFSRRYFEAGGYLDGDLFLYGEEISVAEICRSLSLPIFYEPKLSVVHHEHRSLGTGMTRRTYQYHREAVRYVLARYLTPQ